MVHLTIIKINSALCPALILDISVLPNVMVLETMQFLNRLLISFLFQVILLVMYFCSQVDQSEVPAPAPSSYAHYHKAYSSDSGRDSKASNGSSANANPNTANGYIHDHLHRHGNGATSHTSHTSHPSHSSHHGPPPTLKTTEC